jgi:hypothetical protein
MTISATISPKDQRKHRQPHPHTVRTKDGGTKAFKHLSKAMAIKLLCTECLGWEVNPCDCTSRLCPVYPFRAATRASHKGDKGTV